MGKYKIRLKNNSNVERRIIIFIEAPVVDGVDSRVFRTAYQSSKGPVAGYAWVTFEFDLDVFAITGTSPDGEVDGTSPVETSNSAIAKLAGANGNNQPGSSFVLNAKRGDLARFDSSLYKESCTKPGSFSISCDSVGNENNHQFIGIGLRHGDDANKIIPVAVFTARQSKTYTITPQLKIWVTRSMSEFVPGEIIDVRESQDYIPKPCSIDFAGRNNATTATVEYSHATHDTSAWGSVAYS